MAYSRGTIIKSLFWKYFERLGVQLIQFAVTIVLSRLLLPSEYGTIALIVIFIQLCNVIIDGGFNTALIQKKNSDNIDFSTIFFFSIGVSLLLYLMMYLSSPLIADFYDNQKLIPIIRILSLSLPFYAFNSIQRAYVSKEMLFNKLFYSSLGATILSGVIGIYMAYENYGVWALVAQNISSQFFTTIIMWFTIRWRPIWRFSLNRFKSLFSYGWKIFGSNIIISLFVNSRKIVIGKLYTPAVLAYYEKGDQLPSLIMTNIFTSIQTILFPAFSESQDDRTRVKAMMRISTKLSCFIIYPLIVGLIVIAKPLVVLLFTEKWLPAVPFIQILCIANFFRPVTISNLEAIKALGYSNITFKLEIIKKIIDIIILVASAILGVYYIAWGCVLYDFICVFINLAPNKKLLNYGIKEQVVDAVPTLVIAILSGISVYWIQYLSLSNFFIIFAQLILGLSFYLGISLICKEESCLYLLNLIKDRKK